MPDDRRSRAREGTSSRSEEHTSELQSHLNLVCRLLLEKKKTNDNHNFNMLAGCKRLDEHKLHDRNEFTPLLHQRDHARHDHPEVPPLRNVIRDDSAETA